MANSFIIALILLIIISIIYTVECCAAHASEGKVPWPAEKFAMLDTFGQQRRYGFHPTTTPCPASPCLFGNSFRATEDVCRAMGGTSIGRSQALIRAGAAARGTPREWVTCNMNVAPANVAKYGLGPRESCPDFPIMIRTSGQTCRSLSGKPVGFPADNEMTACQMGLCPIAKAARRIVPVNTPSVGTIAVGEESDAKCRLMGGRPIRRGRCELGIL